MRYREFREVLRSARRDQGLSQTALASRSGTSRVTIARLEAGSAGDVRMGTIGALCEALGLEFAVGPAGSGAALRTRLERERERSRRLDLRRRHALLAARLLAASRSEAAALVGRARATVDRWETQGLCSRHYVARWRAMLSGSVEDVAQGLLEPGEWGDALLQNTPWSSALEPPAA